MRLLSTGLVFFVIASTVVAGNPIAYGLQEVHDQGVILYRRGDYTGCFRVYQGALVAIRSAIPKEVRIYLDAESETAKTMRADQHAFRLHEVMEEVIKRLPDTENSKEVAKEEVKAEKESPKSIKRVEESPEGKPEPVEEKKAEEKKQKDDIIKRTEERLPNGNPKEEKRKVP